MKTLLRQPLFPWLLYLILALGVGTLLFRVLRLDLITEDSDGRSAPVVPAQLGSAESPSPAPPPIPSGRPATREASVVVGSSEAVAEWHKRNSIDPSPRNQGYTDVDRAQGIQYYLHEIKAAHGHLLIGERDERRHYERHLSWVTGEKIMPDLTKFVLRYAKLHSTVGGFLFDARESPPQRVGIIIPEIIDPHPDGPEPLYGEQLEVGVGQVGSYPIEDRPDLEARAVDFELDTNSIILPPPENPAVPATIRVVWLKITPEGRLEPE